MIYRTPNGLPIWRGLAVDRAHLDSLRRSVAEWEALEPHAPDIKRDNDYTREVIRALENTDVHA